MLRNIRDGYTFDDVALVPQYNNIPSRTIPELDTWLTQSIKTKLPFIPANMDTVISPELAEVIIANGGVPIFHRFINFDVQKKLVSRFQDKCFISCGIGDLNPVYELLQLGALGVCIDIAHGHSEMMIDTIRMIKNKFPQKQIIAGNVCTAMGFQDLANAGADAVKVGVGPGCLGKNFLVINKKYEYVPINNVKIGTMILSGENQWVKIIARSKITKDTVKIKTTNQFNPLIITSDHLIFCKWASIGDKGEKQYYQDWRSVESAYSDKCTLINPMNRMINPQKINLISYKVNKNTENNSLTLDHTIGLISGLFSQYGTLKYMEKQEKYGYGFGHANHDKLIKSLKMSHFKDCQYNFDQENNELIITDPQIVNLFVKLKMNDPKILSTSYCEGFLESFENKNNIPWEYGQNIEKFNDFLVDKTIFYDHIHKEIKIINTQNYSHYICSLEPDKQQSVYDIEIDSDSKSFYASGMIVHNSACSTRKVTGFGVPQMTAILECAEIANKLRVPLIADGGIKGSREIALALAAGASTCMIGNLFAKTYESAAPKMIEYIDEETCVKHYYPLEKILKDNMGSFSNYKTDKTYVGKIVAGYRGQASEEFQKDWSGGLKKGTVAEGVAFKTYCSGSAQDLIDELLGGLRSAMTYGGAKNIKELQRKAEFIRVFPSYKEESDPRIHQ
jgi:IMP dehydrogenase/GMP reductase